MLATLSISTREAILLFGLFWAQFVLGAVVPASAGDIERVLVSVAYLLLGAAIFIRQRELLAPLLRDGLRTPYRHLNAGASDGAE